MTNTTNNQENVENMASEGKTELQNIFDQLKKLDLDSDKEGIVCIAYSVKGDDVALMGAVQGKAGRLTKAISEAVATDEHLKEILQRGLLVSLIDKLGI